MSSECLALNNETTRHSSHKKPDEACNLSLNPKGVMSMLCSCRAQTNSYNLVTFYTHLSGDVSLVWKLAHKLIKQRCNCPQQLTKFEHWTNFLQDLWTNFVANGQTMKKYMYGWITSCPKLPQLKALARYKYILMESG